MKILAAVAAQQQKPLDVRMLELDEPERDEVRVKIIATGICRTDLDVRDGYLPTPLPIVLGHEGAGIVEKVGTAVTRLRVGDHVVLSIGRCGVCGPCNQGQPAFCMQHMKLNFGGSRLDGSTCLHDGSTSVYSHFFCQSSHATYAVAHQSSLVKVPKDVDLKFLGPLACGVMTGAGGVLNSLKPAASDSIAIFGAGTVGLSALMAVNILGCERCIVVDNKRSRLELAKELGATHTVLSESGVDVAKQIREFTDGLGVHCAFESSGVRSVISTAFSSLRELGTLVMTGVLPQGTTLEFDAWSLLRGRKIIGSVMGDTDPHFFIPKLVEFYRQGRLPLEKISKVYPLKSINDAIDDSSSGRVVKPIIFMPHGV
ncbi:TPA: NAD(P)-dependent alcohol dehydrogenase [Pseudomonas aeruginosa]|nr:NAD(P)-dependent alcohol dehydrogenase [Pseudomonas aeruginosa]HEP8841270.1 NAD(P)-dependent alcohol dehydrogenase [Pseudomonas aeruginosa]HEP8853868.1 NAD(P)-dependent alcohol dehydrogenase [Pseudomonas aeruginosa]